MKSRNNSPSTVATIPLHKGFVISKVRVKKKCQTFFGGPEDNSDVGHEVSKAGLGVILCAGALIGLGGFLFLLGGLVKSGGITGFVMGWLAALTGI